MAGIARPTPLKATMNYRRRSRKKGQKLQSRDAAKLVVPRGSTTNAAAIAAVENAPEPTKIEAARKAVEAFIPKRRWQRVLLAVSCVVSVSFAVGLKIGELTSIRLTTQDEVVVYLANHAQLVSESDDDIVLRLKTEAISYIYSSKLNKVQKVSLPLDDLQGLKLPRKPLSKDEIAYFKEISEMMVPEAIATVGAAGFWGSLKQVGEGVGTAAEDAGKFVEPLSGEQRLVTYAIVGAGAVSGGLFGYWLTHSDKVEFDEAVFRKTLEDADLWSGFANSIERCRVNELIVSAADLTDQVNKQLKRKGKAKTENLILKRDAVKREKSRCQMLRERLSLIKN